MFKSRAAILLAAKEYQEGKKITQDMISQETGIRRPTISLWLNPKSRFGRVDSKVAEGFCKYFGCPIEDLIEFEGNRIPEPCEAHS